MPSASTIARTICAAANLVSLTVNVDALGCDNKLSKENAASLRRIANIK
jgi:hypothetical protein